jgi:hypothetical protein
MFVHLSENNNSEEKLLADLKRKDNIKYIVSKQNMRTELIEID